MRKRITTTQELEKEVFPVMADISAHLADEMEERYEFTKDEMAAIETYLTEASKILIDLFNGSVDLEKDDKDSINNANHAVMGVMMLTGAAVANHERMKRGKD